MKKYARPLIIIFIFTAVILYSKPWKFFKTEVIPHTIERQIDPKALNQYLANEDSDLENMQKFDKKINQFLKKWEIKGASLAIMKDGKVVYCKGYGYSDIENNIPMQPSNIMRIASVSKLITGIGIMKLIEEGRLALEQKVFGNEGVLNDSIFGDIKDKRCEKITVENLLRHQGGFSIRAGDPMFSLAEVAEKMSIRLPIDINEMIGYVLSQRLGYAPESRTAYSNIGYLILTKVIEKISGTDYQTYIKDSVLSKAGCYDMHIGKNLRKDRYENEVKYYEHKDAEKCIACDGSNTEVDRSNGGNDIELLSGAGGWVASPLELLLLTAAVDGNPKIPDILNPRSIETMTKKIDNNKLPIGWMHTNEDGTWWRTGTLAGTSAILRKEKDGLIWVFVTNTCSWRGSRFPNTINSTIQQLIRDVKDWGNTDLLEIARQRYNQKIN